MMFFLSSWILILLISSTNAVQLDGDCKNGETCEGANILCRDERCQCNTPSYTPCLSSCVLNRNFAYEGEHCEEQDNCVGNTVCSGEKVCRCRDTYTAKNGLCFKNLNVACSNNSECWSQYCLNSQCTCAPGYEPHDDPSSCRRILIDVYENWENANGANQLCSDNSSCVDIVAICTSGIPQPTSKFCKCPYGYQVKDNNKRCEPNVNSLLSPLESLQQNYGECGLCTDDNAACIQAGAQKTCWCRSGYVKNGDRCEQRIKSLIIFPNSNDLNLHDFTNNCANKSNGTTQPDNRLCVCAPDYQFVAKDQACVKLQRDFTDAYEYGVCTRIDSQDIAIREDGLCPEPLTCEVREDKYVCSCGRDKFRDLDDPTLCVYYIGKIATTINDKCPTINARRDSTTGICECLDGYKATNANRQCEIILSSQIVGSSCSSNRSYDEICKVFGEKTFLCTAGECRCSGNQSFPDSTTTRCYAPLDESLVQPRENCPLNSTLVTDQCKCNPGYRSSSNLRQCVPLQLQLIQYGGPSRNTTNSVSTDDCKAWFSGPVELNEGNRCQCNDISFINEDSTGCRYRLNITLPPPPEESAFCPLFSSTGSGQVCQCDDGYTRNDNRCVPMVLRIYSDNDPTAQNTAGLTDSACRKWLGNSAMKSTNGDYCICSPIAYPVESNSYCRFFINARSDDIKGIRTCPANTDVSPSSPPWACVCKPGYHVSADNRTCEPTNIALISTLNIAESHPTNCINFTNDDCMAKYGEQAFCQDEKCYCDRRLSFINAGRCESFSTYTFPGLHERDSYSCNTDKDCGNKENVICGSLSYATQYKVCQCKDGFLLDLKSQTCVENRCGEGCATALGFECRGYECVCKEGYYQNGPVCVEIPYKLQLDQPCNRSALWASSFTTTGNGSLYCNEGCNRVQCKPGYRSEGSSCVLYELNRDKCLYRPNICEGIDQNSVCNRDENQCSCGPSYYQFDRQCVRAVGAVCTRDEECGIAACRGQRCRCTGSQRVQDILDLYGRPMQRCTNGIDRIRFSPIILLILFVLARVFFI